MKHILKFGKYLDLNQPPTVNEALGVPDNITNVAVELLDRLAEQIPDKINFEKKFFDVEGPFKIGDVVFLKTRFVLDLEKSNFKRSVVMFGYGGAGPRRNKNIEKNVVDYNFIYIQLLIDYSTTGEELRTYLKRKKNDLFDKVVHELKHTYDFVKNPQLFSIKDLKDKSKRMGGKYILTNYEKPYDPERKPIALTDFDHIEIDPVVVFFYYLYYTSKEENLARIPQFYAQILGDEVQKKNFKEYVEKNKIIADLKEMRDFSFEKFHSYIVNKFKKDHQYPYNKLERLYNFGDHIGKKDLEYFRRSYGLNDKQIGELVDKFLAVIFEIVKKVSSKKFSEFLDDYVEYEEEHKNQSSRKKDLEDFELEIQKLSKGNWRNFYEEGIRKIKKQADETLRKIYKLYALAK